MPKFELTGRDGSRYEIEAPDENAALAAFSSFQGGTASAEEQGPPKAPDRGITADDLVRSAARGIPVLGGAMDRLAAAGDAALGSVFDRGSQAPTFSERYAENLANEQRRDREFDENSPVASTVAKVAGGVAGLAPAVMAAPAAFGAVGTLPQMVSRGAMSGAGISAADAAVRGDDVTDATAVGGAMGAAAPLVGRGIGHIARAIRGRPAPTPQNIETVAGIEVPLRSSQVTGDAAESAAEQVLLRGGRGEQAQQAAVAFDDLAAARMREATDEIGSRLNPNAAAAGTTRTAPQDAGERVVSELAQQEAERVSRETARLAAMEREAAALRRQVGAGNAYLPAGRGVNVGSPFDAAEQVGDAVRGTAAQARQTRTQRYNDLRNVPGEFEPALFTHIGNSIRTRISAGQSPVRVTPELTPNANEALRVLDETIGGLNFPNAALPAGQRAAPRPITSDTIEEARKQLTALYGDARRAARANAPTGPSDLRAMDRIMDAFDDHLELAARGGFSGDVDALLHAQRVARQSHAAYRATYSKQGPGDEVGAAIEKILGRYDGQAATPDQIAQLAYGSASDPGGGMAIKIAQRLRGILGENSEAWQAYKQGLVSHLLDVPAGATPLTPQQVSERLGKFLTGNKGRGLAQVVFTPDELRAFRSFAETNRSLTSMPDTSDVGKIMRKIAGTDGGIPSTPGEVVDYLYSRTGRGDKGISVRLAQRLKNELSPEGWTMVRQGMWSKLTDAGEGKIPFEAQALSQRINEFLNESGRSLAHVMFNAAERAEMQKLADVYRRMIPVKGTTNPSGTAPMLAKIANAASSNLLAMLGGAQGGFTGLAVGAGADRALRAVANRRALRDVENRFYGPQPRPPVSTSRVPIVAAQGVAPLLD